MNVRAAWRAWAGRCSLALAAALVIASPASCKRQKPNANEDLQKHQKQVLDKMDEIARQVEAERKAKEQKSFEPAAPPAQEAKDPAPAESEPKKDPPPVDKKPSPGGG